MSTGKPVYRRILLKLSGEALCQPGADAGNALASEALTAIANDIRQVTELGVQVGLVVGGGNFFRGIKGVQRGIARTTGDYIGMLATVMNGLAMRDALKANGVPSVLQSAFAIAGVTEPFHNQRAVELLEQGTAVLFAGGTGHPFFTTDTTAALRACEIGADAVLKATKVDGVYSADPRQEGEAVRFESLTYTDALQKRLAVMDSTAFSLCMDNSIPVVVFNFSRPECLLRVVRGDTSLATVVGSDTSVAKEKGE